MQTAISSTIDADALIRLDALAAYTECSRADIMREAINRYLDYVARYTVAVQRGREDVAAGRIVSHEHVIARLQGLGLHVA